MLWLSANIWCFAIDSLAKQQRFFEIEYFQFNIIAEFAFVFKQSLLIDPTDAEALCFLGYCYQNQGFPNDAITTFLPC